MLRHRFRKPPFCLWRGKNVHTKTHEFRTARRICVARVIMHPQKDQRRGYTIYRDALSRVTPGWILTTRHNLRKNTCLLMAPSFLPL